MRDGWQRVKYGTALAPVYAGMERGMHFQVYADETPGRFCRRAAGAPATSPDTCART